MAGLEAVLSARPDLAEAGDSAIADLWAEVHLTSVQSADCGGEPREGAGLQAASRELPPMAAGRALILRRAFDLQALIAVVDGVLLLLPRQRKPRASWTSAR